MHNVDEIKKRFNLVGEDQGLDRAIAVVTRVAATDLSVLITGESGVGKETFPQIIHAYSHRKHNSYVAVNCGAIPDGTIDSELFGHDKGSFTGAHADRKGYFEVANGGTIFLDEVGELPLSTQVKLLRVLESGEFMRVGSSKVLKTDVRVVAATNVNLPEAIDNKKFREDLFYRLNTVPVSIPPLHKRGTDILLLFRKFAVDFAERYNMPSIRLTDSAQRVILGYRWPGNVRELKNITEQISIIEQDRVIDETILIKYIPDSIISNLPSLSKDSIDKETFNSEREILYKVLFDMRQDMNELKALVKDIISNGSGQSEQSEIRSELLHRVYKTDDDIDVDHIPVEELSTEIVHVKPNIEEPDLSLEKNEIEMIRSALKKHRGKRKLAAQELGISERTLYRKIKEFNIK